MMKLPCLENVERVVEMNVDFSKYQCCASFPALEIIVVDSIKYNCEIGY